MIGSQNMFPPVVKNLLIINALFYFATYFVFNEMDINLTEYLALSYWEADSFKPWQFITHLFMHGQDPGHLIFNMFGIWMFGSAIENHWGSKRFLNYYLLTGIGAAILYYAFQHFQIVNLESLISQDYIDLVQQKGLKRDTQYPIDVIEYYYKFNGAALGASGALYGILLAYGMSFPNHKIHLYFLIPIKAKYLVIGYGAIELFRGLQNNPMDNVGHFAHLGGMLFGFIMIRYWRKNDSNFY